MNQIPSIFTDHSISLSPHQVSMFEEFLRLFRQYNAHTNLSAIRDEHGIIEKHFIDSLQLLPHIGDGQNILDIGSGGGFPGIPLRIMLPETTHITLLDSIGKKTRAQKHFIDTLGLHHIEAINARAEVLAKDPTHHKKYDLVVSRATAYISDILPWSLPFLTRHGRILLMKTPSDEERETMKTLTKKLGLTAQEHRYSLTGQERSIWEVRRKSG